MKKETTMKRIARKVYGFVSYEDAVAFVKAAGCASAARLQRGLGIGYSHAAQLIELLERNGVIGPKREGHVLREVLDR